MNAQAIINRVRRLCYVNDRQYTDAQAIEDLNIINNDILSDVNQELNEDYFYQIFKTDTVLGNSEYSLDISVKKIKTLWIKYTSSQEHYTNVREQNINDLEYDLDYYKEGQPKSDPFFYIADNSLFIFPVVEEEVAEGMKMKANIRQYNLTTASAEADLLLSKEYHHIIVEGMKQYVYASRWLIQEKNEAIGSYIEKKDEMIGQLTDRTTSPTVGLLPNLDYYS